jgi:hypothetical protein
VRIYTNYIEKSRIKFLYLSGVLANNFFKKFLELRVNIYGGFFFFFWSLYCPLECCHREKVEDRKEKKKKGEEDQDGEKRPRQEKKGEKEKEKEKKKKKREKKRRRR